MRTKKSKERRRLDNLVQEGLALLICDLTKKAREKDESAGETEWYIIHIDRLCDTYRRVGE